MSEDQIFRGLFILAFVSALGISAFFRFRARQNGGTIPRKNEGYRTLLLRIVFAAVFYTALLSYMINPNWMYWSSFQEPTWLRIVGISWALAMLPLLYWVLVSLGKNISETFLTKDRHQLITRGPYRWIRHPLYTFASGLFLGLGIAAANWLIIGLAILMFIAIAAFVVPREEAELSHKFGRAYDEYRMRAGRYLPRIPGRS